MFDQSVGRCVAGNTETCERIKNGCKDKVNGTVVAHPNECELFVLCKGGEIFNLQAQFCAPGNGDTCQFHSVEIMCQNATEGTICPHPNSCIQFVRFISNQAVTIVCPTGQIFHAPCGSCRAENTNTCELIGNVCEDQPDFLVLAHPSICSLFLWCQGGAITIQSCPGGEILRPDAHIYYPRTRSCVPGNDDTCELFDNICFGRPNGILPYPTTCTAFVYCNAGQPMFERCSPGTIFKQGLSGCVVGNTETCTEWSKICTEHVDGSVLEHPSECNLFVVCMMQHPGVLSCSVGEIFNTKVLFCTPGNKNTCEIHPVKTMCKNMPHGSVYPHPSDCNQTGGLYSLPTSNRLFVVHFLPSTEQFRAELPCWHASQRSCVPGNDATCERFDKICVGRTEGSIAHRTICTAFIRCVSSLPVYLQCVAGMIFEPSLGGCFVGNTKTCSRTDGVCEGQPDGTVLAHPNECDLYILCVSQQAAPIR
uniref:Chitin-binding type-2 domain-containing protein n=1 Tax=Anopheles christyi TaxID=43041 RepID=A0A182K5E5_9DIPT